VYLIPHQGSSSSTSDGILEVFHKAKKFQETGTREFPVVSVVLLDGVELAEVSPHNPLKVLHSLLEPSYPIDIPTVSVVGISNRRLDISKSSRAILVQRPKFGIDDLVDTAARLLENEGAGKIQRMSLKPLAEAYSEYEQTGQIHPNFHGLRDYYGLVKSLSKTEMTPENIQMALARNFSGTDQSAKLYEEYFSKVLQKFNNYAHWEYKPIPISTLINANLNDESARHLMVIGKGDFVVNILIHHLYNEGKFKEEGLDPVVIMGSQFPDDQQDYSYSVLSRIMMCVETGRPLILTDLEIIYGALYDLWNQNYVVYGSNDNPRHYARVALGDANPMLNVNKKFKCILVLDESNLPITDPHLLSRFEKQKLSAEDILTEKQHELLKSLNTWTKQMVTIIEKNNFTVCHDFTLEDLFIGYDPEKTLQSLVISTMHQNEGATNEEILETCKESLISIASSDGIIRATKSVMRKEESLRWMRIYFSNEFKNQHHDNLMNYFNGLLNSHMVNSDPLLVVVTTFSNINTNIKGCLETVLRVQVETISTFRTEIQLQNRVKHFWLDSDDQMLVLQCEVAIMNSRCIKLAKFIVEQYRDEFLRIRKVGTTSKHACIILHVHRGKKENFLSFGFMRGWKQVTIETLEPQGKHLLTILDESVTNIINTAYPFEDILKQELSWCLLCMKYPSDEDSINRLRMLNSEILQHPSFISCLKERTLAWLEERYLTDWQYDVAFNKKLLYPYSSFSAALHARIRTMVRRPVAKMLFALESFSTTKTFFNMDQPGNEGSPLLIFWKTMFNDPKVIEIDDLPEPNLDQYILPYYLHDLQFPFSYYIMRKIDDFKDTCLEKLDSLKQDRKTIEPYLEKYFNDFVTIISTRIGRKNNNESFSLLLRQFMGEEMYDPVLIHICWWVNSSKILAAL
ncbi:15136_t:CDS:2, partial [Acaulospora morrowiae]